MNSEFGTTDSTEYRRKYTGLSPSSFFCQGEFLAGGHSQTRSFLSSVESVKSVVKNSEFWLSGRYGRGPRLA
jgi:hypothetical protein